MQFATSSKTGGYRNGETTGDIDEHEPRPWLSERLILKDSDNLNSDADTSLSYSVLVHSKNSNCTR